MAVGLIYGQAGAGKTVNSCRVNTRKRGKNVLLNSDYSNVVLNNFDEIKKTTDIIEIKHWVEKDLKGVAQDNFINQFKEVANSNKYDCIIVDNLTDLFDMAVNEMAEFPKHDGRHDYLVIYQQMKRLVRLANQVDCNVLFTAWELVDDVPLATGELVKRVRPQLQAKIVDQIVGLSQVVGRVCHTENGQYFYDYRGSVSMYAKDQLFLRQLGKPENIFDGKEEKKS